MSPAITFELRRPFAGAVISSDNVGTLTNQFTTSGRRGTGIDYTHTLDVAGDFDIRDGCARAVNTPNIAYGDGDEVRIPDATGSIYVVVWVENLITPPGTPTRKRAYLLRDTAVWPGP